MEISFSKPSLVKSRTPKKLKVSSTVKTQIHSKIEKRRRDKMNTYISQLSTMIPTCNITTHKLDKITVLRMAVQYLKSIRSSPMQFSSEENLKYSFISDMELKRLILQVSEGFLFAVGCENGRILYISESVTKILNCNQGELLGRSLYDVIHPGDTDKVKGQISCVDLNPRHKLMGLKSVKDLDLDVPSEQLGLYPGNRRSFFFRIKSDVDDSGKYTMGMNTSYENYKNMNDLAPVNIENYNSDQYTTIHCVGYLKCWNSSGNTECSEEDGKDSSSLTCLIAIGRPLNNFSQTFQEERPSKFRSKHTIDGKFLFVDHWATLITGFLPQELLGTSIYDYIHPDDVNEFAEAHRLILQPFSGGNITKNYRFRTKFSNFVNIQSEWKCLQNPWKKEVEYFYSDNTVNWDSDTKLTAQERTDESTLAQNELFTFPNFTTGKESQNLISEFGFHNDICEKNNNEVTMEAILKLLESDTNIAD